MNLLNRDFRQMKIAGQHTPFWGGQDGRFLQPNFELEQQILSFGESVQVLAPIELKNRITSRLQQALSNYNL